MDEWQRRTNARPTDPDSHWASFQSKTLDTRLPPAPGLDTDAAAEPFNVVFGMANGRSSIQALDPLKLPTYFFTAKPTLRVECYSLTKAQARSCNTCYLL